MRVRKAAKNSLTALFLHTSYIPPHLSIFTFYIPYQRYSPSCRHCRRFAVVIVGLTALLTAPTFSLADALYLCIYLDLSPSLPLSLFVFFISVSLHKQACAA
ncbi:uncharacterized protein K452DRAFT_282518, partial [Aplosporella prunicola CBS 121167]